MLRPRTGTGAGLLATVVLVASALSAVAGGGYQDKDTATTPPPQATGEASNGAVNAGATTEVRVDTGGSTTGGTPFSSTKGVEVPRRCWYGAGYSGQEYYEVWGPDGTAYTSPSANGHIAPSLHDGFEQHQDETTGRWYAAECASHVSREDAAAYRAAHPPVYVMPGTDPPPTDEGLDPAFLAEVAFEHMELPVGTIRWNPTLQGSGATLVNWETFIWVENAATQVQVSASVPGVTSTVTARMSGMTLQADGAEENTCTDTGTPYVTGMKSSSCFIVFHRSSANQPIKDGQTLPTATLNATATWTATWTSTLDPAIYELESQPVSTTAEIPVAEIQTIVTR